MSLPKSLLVFLILLLALLGLLGLIYYQKISRLTVVVTSDIPELQPEVANQGLLQAYISERGLFAERELPFLGSAQPRNVRVRKLTLRLTDQFPQQPFNIILDGQSQERVEAIGPAGFDKDKGEMVIDVFILPERILEAPEEHRTEVVETIILEKLEVLDSLAQKGESPKAPEELDEIYDHIFKFYEKNGNRHFLTLK